MMPLIGLIPLYDDERESYWMLPGYMQALQRCGAVPIMLPLTADTAMLDRAAEVCSGLLFTGGHDVGADIYGETPAPACGAPCPLRDRMEKYLLQKAVAEDIPLLGICRGIQFINAALGGTLYQDIPTEYETKIDHHMQPPYDRAVHAVQLLPGTPLERLLGCQTLGVNSYHHQAVKRLAPSLAPMAISEDGLTEAVYMPGKRFIMGVQWHPELSYQTSPASMAIMQAFVNACGDDFNF